MPHEWMPAAIWLAGINLFAFFLMGWDKHKAKTGGWRVSEKGLFLSALLGGSLGAIAGMQAFRHKTKHWYFQCGIPAILLAQVALAVWMLR